MIAWAGDVSGTVSILARAPGGRDWTPANSNANAVVYLTGFDEKSPANRPQVYLDQKDKTFVPRVLAVTAGDKVSFRNRDDVYHNVWSISPTKTFDLGSYVAPKEEAVTFDKPGLVRVFCNIHPQMIASVLVLKNSKYVVTPESGGYKINDVPNGELQLRVWVEGSDPVVKTIHVGPASHLVEDFTVKRLPPPIAHLNKFGKPYSKY